MSNYSRTLMKIKLNRARMTGLYNLIDHNLIENPATNKAEQILNLLVHQIRIKIRNRLEAQVNDKDNYRVNLQQTEALAFELWFNNCQIRPFYYNYELLIAQQLIGEIDKTYGTNLNNR